MLNIDNIADAICQERDTKNLFEAIKEKDLVKVEAALLGNINFKHVEKGKNIVSFLCDNIKDDMKVPKILNLFKKKFYEDQENFKVLESFKSKLCEDKGSLDYQSLVNAETFHFILEVDKMTGMVCDIQENPVMQSQIYNPSSSSLVRIVLNGNVFEFNV